MTGLVFWAMVAAFFTHELDAVKRHEWRVLPVLRGMPDAVGEQLFIWLHVPLFAVVLWSTHADSSGVFAQSVSAFAIVHVGLHWLFWRHPAYEFNNLSSWGLIVLTGGLGALHLYLVLIA